MLDATSVLVMSDWTLPKPPFFIGRDGLVSLLGGVSTLRISVRAVHLVEEGGA